MRCSGAGTHNDLVSGGLGGRGGQLPRQLAGPGERGGPRRGGVGGENRRLEADLGDVVDADEPKPVVEELRMEVHPELNRGAGGVDAAGVDDDRPLALKQRV